MKSKKTLKRLRIRRSIRKKIQGTSDRPRLSVFKSNRAIYVQLVDDTTGYTLVQSSSRYLKLAGKNDCEAAKKVGQHLAELALKKKITHVIFDRGGYPYHGKLSALAEGARATGLNF